MNGSLNITPLTAFADNYIWLLEHNGEAVAVDAGQAEPVAGYVRRHGLRLVQIWTTHAHADHTGGIGSLKRQFPDCRVFAAADVQTADETVSEGSEIIWQNWRVQVWHTPGHTAHHLSYLLHDEAQPHLFCGDTLFSAGCGRVLDGGNINALHQSFCRINTLPAHTLLYPAHEYTAANLRFAACAEPHNADIAAALSQLRTPSLPTTLARERQINPFVRAGRDAAEFARLRERKNRF